jgi:hypothetical protein
MRENPSVNTTAIDDRISELVGAHRSELVELVRQAVDRELQVLVAAELEHRANGNGAPAVQEATPAPPLRTCKGCGRTLDVSRFEAHRYRCKDCRRADAASSRERRSPAEPEPPRTVARDLT